MTTDTTSCLTLYSLNTPKSWKTNYLIWLLVYSQPCRL